MNLFWTCPKTWYLKYIQKIPVKEDLVYAHRGSVVHHCMETYYPKKIMTMEELKTLFNEEWEKYKLHKSKLCRAKEDTWKMVMNGVELNLPMTDVELAVSFDDFRGFIDVVNKDTLTIWDWKTSTRSEHNELEYLAQVKVYAWLYYRKFGVLPKYTGVKYLKYSGADAELGCVPTMDDIKNVEEWTQKTQDKMQFYIDNPQRLPSFNKNYFFSPYKHLWVLNFEEQMIFDVELYGNTIIVNGCDEFLNNHFYNKYTYELDDARNKERAIKMKYKDSKRNINLNINNTEIHLWDKYKLQTFIGFYEEIIQSLKDYANHKNKIPILKIKDMRIKNEAVIDVPQKLLTDKTLMKHQQDAVDIFLNKKMGCIEVATGGGKSVIIAEIIRNIPYNTLIVIDSAELLYQLQETIEEELGIECGIVGDGKKEIKHVTVATIQTLNRNLSVFAEWLYNVRTVIFDEAHHVASDSYFNLCKKLKNVEYRLGTTATFQRDDGHDKKLDALIGPKLCSVKSIDLMEKDLLMKPSINFIKYAIPKEDMKNMDVLALGDAINPTPEYLPFYNVKIINNVFRNTIIKSLTDEHHDKSILILIKNIEHGELLNKLIPNSEYLNGKTPKKTRKGFIDDFKSKKLRVLISSAAILSEGFNFPELEMMINAAANVGEIKTVQGIGRILRKHKNKKQALYYDFFDEGTFFARASLDRMKKFKKEGYYIVMKT